MTGTERKRIWRLHNPERRRAAERARAQARREGYWLGRAPWAEDPRPSARANHIVSTNSAYQERCSACSTHVTGREHTGYHLNSFANRV